jgi:glycosyltransferase involved in cell wall biosynthesis
MPTFRCREWIDSAIRSVVSQQLSNLDLYVADDGGSDVSDELLAEFPQVTFLRIRERRGPYHANNLMLQIVDSEYVGFQDADDWSAAERFSAQLSFLEKTGHDGCGAWCVHVDITCDPIGFDVCPGAFDLFPPAMRARVPFHPTSLYRRAVFDRLGGFDAGTSFAADSEFIWRAHRNFSLANVPKFLYYRRVRPSSLTQNADTGINRPSRAAYLAQIQVGIEALGLTGSPDPGTLATGAPVQFPPLHRIEWIRPGRGNQTLKQITLPEKRQ